MSGAKQQGARFAFLATLAAAAAITFGAAVCIAPLWQPGRALHTEPLPDTAAAEPAPPEPIDVNTADEETLQALPGIGEAKARAIVEWREEHGPFQMLDELEQISGISARMVEGWQGLATAGNNDKGA